MHLTRLRDGLLVEHWAVRDDLAMLQQLGMVFMPEEANEVHQEREQREAMDFTLTEEQADMEMEIEVARTMYYKAAWLQMQGKP